MGTTEPMEMNIPPFVQLLVQASLLALNERFPIMVVNQTMNESHSTPEK